MIVLHFTKVSTLYPTHSDFMTFLRLENLPVAMPTKAQSQCRGVRLGDHYMPLQRFTIGVCHT
jgi:hypothetical protein